MARTAHSCKELQLLLLLLIWNFELSWVWSNTEVPLRALFLAHALLRLLIYLNVLLNTRLCLYQILFKFSLSLSLFSSKHRPALLGKCFWSFQTAPRRSAAKVISLDSVHTADSCRCVADSSHGHHSQTNPFVVALFCKQRHLSGARYTSS